MNVNQVYDTIENENLWDNFEKYRNLSLNKVPKKNNKKDDLEILSESLSEEEEKEMINQYKQYAYCRQDIVMKDKFKFILSVKDIRPVLNIFQMILTYQNRILLLKPTQLEQFRKAQNSLQNGIMKQRKNQ